MSSRLARCTVLILLGWLTVSGSAVGAQPCTDQMAWTKAGSWAVGSGHDLMVDRSFPKAEYPLALRKADQVVALLKEAIGKPDGIEARVSRSFRDSSYTKDGALKVDVRTGFFGYYCVPDTPSFPTVRGQVRLGDETGTWIEISFNSFSWLVHEKTMLDKSLRAGGGGALFLFPKQDGEWNGLPLLHPTLHQPRRSEAVIIAPAGRTPYRFITRQEFLEARERQVQGRIDGLPKLRDPARALPALESELQKIRSALQSLTPEERRTEAMVRLSSVVPGGRESVFATEAEGGRRVFVISARFFDATLPRHAVQFITVYWRWDAKASDRAKVEMVRQFKARFDVQALRDMLGR
jgi:hypothetical protein